MGLVLWGELGEQEEGVVSAEQVGIQEGFTEEGFGWVLLAGVFQR